MSKPQENPIVAQWITTPDNLDTEHVARVQALLDAFALTAHGALFLHESTCTHLAYAVAEWAQRTKRKIETKIVSSNGCTYETWDIYVAGSPCDPVIHVFPKAIGLLDDKDDLKIKIAAIRKDADERIRELLDVEQARSASS